MADVYSLLKGSFKDILQELMEAELDASLGCEKNQKGGAPTSNKRNGHSPKTLKSQYGKFQIDVPKDWNGEYEPDYREEHSRFCERHSISYHENVPINWNYFTTDLSSRSIKDAIQCPDY